MADQDFVINIRTTANTAGIQQIQGALQALGAQVQSINAKTGGGAGGGGGGEEPTSVLDKAAAKIEHGIFRSFVHAIGIGVVYELVGALTKEAEEIEKVSAALDKQSDQLVKIAQLGTHQASFAKDENEALKITDARLKDIATTRKTLADITQKDTSNFSSFSQTAANFSDWLNVQLFQNTGKKIGDYEAARLENAKTAFAQLQAAQKEALDEVLRTEEAKQRSYEETVKELNNLIAAEEEHKAIAAESNDAERYAEAANKITQYSTELAGATQLEEKRQKEITDFNKDNAENLTLQKTKEEELNEALNRVHETLRILGADAKTPAEAFEKGVQMGGALGETVKALAAEFAKLAAERSKLETKQFGAPLTEAGRAQEGRVEEYGRLGQQLGQIGAAGETRTMTPLEEKQARDAFVNTQTEMRDKFIQGEKDRRQEESDAVRKRYEEGFGPEKPGQPQMERNADIVRAIQELRDLWK